jgi:hypothetical protein
VRRRASGDDYASVLVVPDGKLIWGTRVGEIFYAGAPIRRLEGRRALGGTSEDALTGPTKMVQKKKCSLAQQKLQGLTFETRTSVVVPFRIDRGQAVKGGRFQ